MSQYDLKIVCAKFRRIYHGIIYFLFACRLHVGNTVYCRGPNVQGAERVGGRTCRGPNVQGAERVGGRTCRGPNRQGAEMTGYPWGHLQFMQKRSLLSSYTCIRNFTVPVLQIQF